MRRNGEIGGGQDAEAGERSVGTPAHEDAGRGTGRKHALSGDMVVIATRNQGKVREFAGMFAPLGLTVRSLADFEGIPDIVEDGDTFEENALIKARVVAQHLGVPVLADDSGLAVDALDGAPGVYSARYAGEGAADAANNAKLLAELQLRLGPEPPVRLGEGHPAAWSAGAFVCAVALVDPAGGEPLAARGECRGYLLAEPRGANGFGYDPLFYLPEHRATMAELPMEEKNAISHRSLALQELLAMLE